jgi:hypothetical protein
VPPTPSQQPPAQQPRSPQRPSPDAVKLKIPASGSESVTADRAAERIAQIQQAHPTAEIEVSIRWKSRGT